MASRGLKNLDYPKDSRCPKVIVIFQVRVGGGGGGAYVPGTLLDVYLAENLLLVLYQQVFQSSLKISQTGVS